MILFPIQFIYSKKLTPLFIDAVFKDGSVTPNLQPSDLKKLR